MKALLSILSFGAKDIFKQDANHSVDLTPAALDRQVDRILGGAPTEDVDATPSADGDDKEEDAALEDVRELQVSNN